MRSIFKDRRTFFFFCSFLLLLHSLPAFADEALPSKVLEQISEAVFEVVVPKPTKDSLKYKEPLPLNRIPFTVRNDRYYSIGTAFSIGPNLFVSAAHVMGMGADTQWGEPMLRDRSGTIFAIDKIVKYSERRDFLVFTLKKCTVRGPLEVNQEPKVNRRVFAVGNALGEGIVIRDGLYTSDTLEQEDGSFKWMRFSAAASPGNSGGPLLDQSGHVIGVILRKSPNENLNIALPIGEVMRHRDLAHFHRPSSFSLPILDRTKHNTADTFLALPLSFSELNLALAENANYFDHSSAQSYFLEMTGVAFPNGVGSKALLNSSYTPVFPALIKMSDDGNWETSTISTRSVDLGQNGSIAYGETDGSLVISLHKPESVSLEKLYGDEGFFMELVLKGIKFSREVGDSQVRITSLGAPAKRSTFRDNYGRIWLVRSWLREYNNTKIVAFSLPTPEGMVILMRMDRTGTVDTAHIPTLKTLTNFISLSYSGTLREWKEFLLCRHLIPAPLSSAQITRDGDGFSYSSSRYLLKVPKKVMNVTDDSNFLLSMGYFEQNGSVTWDVNSIWLSEDRSGGTLVSVSRHPKPPPELNRDFQTFWENLTKARFPFNKSAFSSEGNTRIMARVEPEVAKNTRLLHSVLFSGSGSVKQGAMEGKLEKILDGLTVKENGEEAGQDRSAAPLTPVPFERYSRVLQEDATTPLRQSFRGVAELAAGNVDQALELFAKAEHLDPACQILYLGRGQAYLARKELDKAEENLSRALTLNPWDVRAMTDLGTTFLQRKLYDKAIEQFDKALLIHPRMSDALINRAIAFEAQKKNDRALSDLNAVIELDPSNWKNIYRRGIHYRATGEYAKALADFDRVAEAEESSGRFGRGLVKETKGDVDEAVKEYTAAIRAKPNYLDAHLRRGFLYARNRKAEEAAADFSAVIGIDPTNLLAYGGRGMCFTMLGANDKAVQDFTKAIELDPTSAELYARRGYSYTRCNRSEEALRDADRAIALLPSYSLAYHVRGMAHGMRQSFAQSLADFNRALELDPKNPELYLHRGNTKMFGKDLLSALADFNRALQLDEKMAFAYTGRGMLYAQMKQMGNACLDWERACTLGLCEDIAKAKKKGECLGL